MPGFFGSKCLAFDNSVAAANFLDDGHSHEIMPLGMHLIYPHRPLTVKKPDYQLEISRRLLHEPKHEMHTLPTIMTVDDLCEEFLRGARAISNRYRLTNFVDASPISRSVLSYLDD